MLSIRNIASTTGYGIATVSMALRNDPKIPEKTRLLIQETARQLGYTPDTRISKLMAEIKQKRIHRINQPLAYVLFWESVKEHYLYNNYRLFRDGAQRRAKEFGYTFEDFVIGSGNLSPQRFNSIMRTRSIPGALIAPVSHSGLDISEQGRQTKLIVTDYAAATIAYSLSDPILHRATHDHALGSALAMDQCLSRGYKRIGFFCTKAMNIRVNGRWLSGFLQKQCLLPDLQKIPPLITDETKNTVSFDRWFNHYCPEVIITDEAEQVILYLTKMNLQIPENIGLVHLDVPDNASHYTGINQCCTDIGSAAFDLLLAQINRNERGSPSIRKTVLLEPIWHEGRTLNAQNHSHHNS